MNPAEPSSAVTSLTHGPRQSGYQRLLIPYLVLSAITWIVFGQTTGFDFVDYDDPSYVYQNPEISGGITLKGVAHAFVQPHARNWHPLTTVSHMLDCQLFGLDPAGHHLVNVLLHMIAVLLLFSLLHQMTGAVWRSLFAAAVFAIHPLRAESVAWIAERKDVLSAVFFMLTLGAYVRYARRPAIGAYLVVVCLFTFGLMAKPMLVTLPLLLLLVDYWPLGRFQDQPPHGPRMFRRLVWEKIPLLFLSLAAGTATLMTQRQTVDYGQHLPLVSRMANALITALIYMSEMLWPARLAVFYPQDAGLHHQVRLLLALLILTGITAAVFFYRRTHPYLVAGWFWYLISLLPVIGLIQVGLQARADRYTYLPEIGLVLALTWGVVQCWPSQRKLRPVLGIMATLIVTVLTWRGMIQTSYWRNTEALWRHALAVTADNDVAHYNVAALALQQGRLDDAIFHYQEALRIRGASETHDHLSSAIIHNSLGNALARKGQLNDAAPHYAAALKLRPDFADAHSNLAAILARNGRMEEALAHCEKAIVIPPDDATSHILFGDLLVQHGCETEAMTQYWHALELVPDSPDALNGLAWIFATSLDVAVRNGPAAVELAEEATRVTAARNPVVLRTLAASYSAAGRPREAVMAAGRALRLANDTSLSRHLQQEGALYQAQASRRRVNRVSDR